jgi:hypothetical protein
MNNTIKKWYWALGAIGTIVIILILLQGVGENSVSNFYIIPAGIFSPFHENTNATGPNVPGNTTLSQEKTCYADNPTFPVSAGRCRENVKISEGEAVRIAVNDSATLRWIDTHTFKVIDVGISSISSSDGIPEEVYAIIIEKNGARERFTVFVNFEGIVVRTGTSYTAQAPDSLMKTMNGTPV